MKVLVTAGFQLEGGRVVGKGDVLDLPDGVVPGLLQTGRVVPYDAPAALVTREGPATAAADTPLVRTTKRRGRRGPGG